MASPGWAAALLPLALFAQTQSIDIVLERHEDGVWKTIEPGLVLDQNDLVRFRFRSTFGGYLYVLNSGTSGSQSLLFPGEATGRANRVQPGTDYSVPSTGASFKVTGPPGHDVVYWLVSPVPLDGAALAAPGRQPPKPAGTLTPRCDQTIFRARGLCIDSSAGPRNVPAGKELPPAVAAVPNLRPRELTIMQEKNRARVSSPEKLTGPFVYEFRIPHR
jgi:hypothetical protein